MSSDKNHSVAKHSKESPCPICGGTRFTWGKPLGKTYTRFRPADAGLLSWGEPMEARKCNNCGNVQLFTKE
jgi:hypothetical protein